MTDEQLGIARLQKSVETSDWCELKPEEAAGVLAEVERLKGELAERDEAREVLAGNATLEQDAFDENVAVRIPIKAWRTFWELPLSARDPQVHGRDCECESCEEYNEAARDPQRKPR